VPKLPKGLFRRGSSFYVRVQRDYRRVWRSLGADYETACTRLRALKRDEPVAISRTRVKDAAERWLETYVATRRAPRNMQMARRRAEMYLYPFLALKPLERVTAQDLREYRLWLERKPRLSPQSVGHILSDCRCMLNWARDEGLIAASPVPRRLLPRIQERPPDRLTDEEVRAVTGLPDPFGFLCRLGVGSGLRWGELVRAQASHFQDGVLIVSLTKSGKVRRVPLSDQLAAEVRCRVGLLLPFSGKSSSYVSRTIRTLSKVERFHLHQLRHSFACRWLEAGGSIEALREAMGHSTVRMTERYGRLSDAHVRAEAERVWVRLGESAGR
jgi:integrase